MNTAVLIAILVARVFAALIAVWQVLGLFPIVKWFSAPSQITVGMWSVLAIKLIILFVGLLTFFGLQRLSSKLLVRGQVHDVSA